MRTVAGTVQLLDGFQAWFGIQLVPGAVPKGHVAFRQPAQQHRKVCWCGCEKFCAACLRTFPGTFIFLIYLQPLYFIVEVLSCFYKESVFFFSFFTNKLNFFSMHPRASLKKKTGACQFECFWKRMQLSTTPPDSFQFPKS